VPAVAAGKTASSEYKGYGINAGAVLLTDNERFVSTLTISRNHGDHCSDKTFRTGYFRDASEAMKSAATFARRVIDGKVAGVSVSDL
jgi:hypothetical protein